MKKIKKLLTIGLSVLLMLCMGISLFGCSIGDKFNHERFYGVVCFSEECNQLVVYIPKVGDVSIPDCDRCVSPFDEYEDGEAKNDQYSLKAGDYVVINFRYEKSWDENSVKIMEMYPAKFDRRADSIEVLQENVSFGKTDNGYELSFPSTAELESAELGDTLYFVQHGGENGKAYKKLYAEGVITSKSDGIIAVVLIIPEGETEFLDYYNEMTVELTWVE